MSDDKKRISTEETENNIEAAEQQVSLDSLLLDGDDETNGKEIVEDSINFEAFMAEYRNLMSQSIAEAKAAESEEIDEEDEKEFLKTPPKKSAQTKKSKKQEKPEKEPEKPDEWSEDITLAPQEYEDLDDGKELEEEVLPEEESVPDFNLGETTEESDDKFQISINFEGEQKKADAADEPKERKYDPDKPRIIDWVFDIAEMFVFVLVAVMLLTAFVFKHSIVEGDSMLNTLEDGDHLIISDLFYSPERGDIIVFEDYSTALKKPVVKRIIGLPGETVEVKINKSGVYEVYINGEYLDEPYAYTDIDYSAPGVGVWTVGEGEIFVMGDNRYNSTDSRDGRVGTIDIDSILGRVLFRFYPFNKFGSVK